MGPKGINWTGAFQFYCETIDGRLPSYQDVAIKFGVSKTEVGQRALEENWIKLRQELYENGKNRFLENKTNLIAEAENNQFNYWRKVQNLLDILLDELEINLSLNQASKLYSLTRIMKVAIEGERTVLGLPNTVLADKFEPIKQSPQKLQPVYNLGGWLAMHCLPHWLWNIRRIGCINIHSLTLKLTRVSQNQCFSFSSNLTLCS